MTLSQFITSFTELLTSLVGHAQDESFFWPVAGAGLGVFFVLSWVLARTAFGNETGMGTSLMVFGLQLGFGLVMAAIAGPLAQEHVADPFWDLPLVIAAGIGGCILFGMIVNRIFLGMKLTATAFVLGLSLSLSWVAMAGARMSVDLFESGAANVNLNKERKDNRIPR